ncbi:non-specific phospholipase C1 [Cajanus cajan]|uniref:non-specific phospholipase C1 n=1 Tax=Cajanus cajan TaxID=3821 RepID=UPI00098D964D|nr:non-specific phospholipase C1 [Cajanus cajan]
MGLRRTPLLLLLLILLLSPSPSAAFRKKHKLPGPIKTIVVIVMENRSFDHVLGWLKPSRPDIDGLTGKESNPLSVSSPESPRIPVTDDALFIDGDPGHSFQAIREQIFGSNVTSLTPAPMNGFAQQAESIKPGFSKTVMSAFKPQILPVYTKLAHHFGVFDKWFASVPASTQPNRFYVHSATSHGAMSNVRKDLIHGFPQKTIFDSLADNGLSFGIYYQNIPATLFFKTLRKLKNALNFHDYALKFRKHAEKGKLPNYVVIEQRYFDVEVFPANDDHPSHDVAAGQMFVKEVYEILRKSPQWEQMAILITYDEHGGFYDHVPTPVVGVPNPDGIIGPHPYYFGFDRLGVRVPTFLISPWIEKGTVIHEAEGPTPYSQYEHSSIPATVKKLFNLKSNFLTKKCRKPVSGRWRHYLALIVCNGNATYFSFNIQVGIGQIWKQWTRLEEDALAGVAKALAAAEEAAEAPKASIDGDKVMLPVPTIEAMVVVTVENSGAEDVVNKNEPCGFNPPASQKMKMKMKPIIHSLA